jgi:hypothetical protein
VVFHQVAFWRYIRTWQVVFQNYSATIGGDVRYSEDYAQAMGLYYRLRTNAEIDWVVQNNLQFLEDYFRGAITAVEEKQQTKILSSLRLLVNCY